MATASVSPDHDAVTAEIFVAAPPERVFQAITDAKQMPLWWGDPELYRITEWKGDLRVGGKWSSDGIGKDGKTFRVEGEYLVIDPPHLLVHTWVADYAGGTRTVVRWELAPHSVHGLHPEEPQRAATGTLVKIRHEGFAGNVAAVTSHGEGWKRVMGWLSRFVENGETVDTRARI